MFKFRRTKISERQEEYLDRQAKKFPKLVFILFLIYFVVFGSFMAWYLYFKSTYTISKVEGTSMQDTLNPHTTGSDDMVYVNRSKTVERFDIVIIESTKNVNGQIEPVLLIKRAIGFGGEYITIMQDEEGILRIWQYDESSQTATAFDEPYVKYISTWSQDVHYDGKHNYESKFYYNYLAPSSKYETQTFDGVTYFKVPEDELFYLGDNRTVSYDARERGTAKMSAVEGVAEIILPNASKPNANVLGIKIKSIVEFYWHKLTDFLSRS